MPLLVRTLLCFQRIFKKEFDSESMKKTPTKVAHNRPPTFFMYWPSCQNGPEREMPCHQKPLNAGLGIRLGCYCCNAHKPRLLRGCCQLE